MTTALWLICERLKGLELAEVLFARFDEPLAQEGYVAKAGQMIDATLVEAPRQRNTREENAQIKIGELPDGWDDPDEFIHGYRARGWEIRIF